ncbi:MAG: hypothetical protein WCJ35_25270 [Planctomycetota bacterium]
MLGCPIEHQHCFIRDIAGKAGRGVAQHDDGGSTAGQRVSDSEPIDGIALVKARVTVPEDGRRTTGPLRCSRSVRVTHHYPAPPTLRRASSDSSWQGYDQGQGCPLWSMGLARRRTTRSLDRATALIPDGSTE